MVVQSVSKMSAMVVLLLLGLLQLVVPGLAQNPPSGTVKIVSVKYAGTGCPPGSAESIIAADGTALTVIFSKYTASTPGNPADRRKNCQVVVTLSYPTGFTFTLGTVTFRGYAQLEKAVRGRLAASYYLIGVPGTVRTSRDLTTPFDGNFEFTDKFATFIFQPCGRPPVGLVINSEASVNPPLSPPNAVGVITVDSQDLKLTQRFRLTWKKC